MTSSNIRAGGIRVPWKVFPVERYEEVSHLHGASNIKIIHVIRHAEATHNVQNDYTSPSNLDARLTPKGKQQCLHRRRRAVEQIPTLGAEGAADICVLTSPMTRCVQTALYSFTNLPIDGTEPLNQDVTQLTTAPSTVPFLALESLRETVNYTCDRRRGIPLLKHEFPRIDFSLYQNDSHAPSDECHHDGIWNSYIARGVLDDAAKESTELHVVARRGYEAFDFLQRRAEREIVVCTHSAFLRCVLNWGQVGGVPDTKEQTSRGWVPTDDYPLFDYDAGGEETDRFQDYMRRNYDNCELRSFCMLVQDID